MSMKEAYKQKIEAEIERAQAKLADLKAEAKSAAADARIRIQYDQHIEELQYRIDVAKAKLKELGEASEDAWEQFKDGTESAWSTLSNAVRDSATKLKDKF